MSLSVAILMDPLEKLKLVSDSSIILALEASRRGYKVFYFTPKDLFLKNTKVFANLTKLNLIADDPFATKAEGCAEVVNLEEMDIVLIRQDPPFDMSYLTTTYLLELISHKVLMINNPTEIRNSPEKLFLNRFPTLLPPTLITQDLLQIDEFYKEHEEIILKPLYSFGGQDVFYIKKDDPNYKVALEILFSKYQDSIIIQKYISEIKKGDKRIILAGGDPVGSLLRKPGENQIRSNLAVGGAGEKSDLSARDIEICDMIAPILKQKGLIMVGIDVIGEYLTEINVTSPTGIAAINKLSEVRLEMLIWERIENLLR